MRSIITIFILSIICFGCCKEPVIFEPLEENDCIESFIDINDLKLAPADDTTCIFYNIYKFEGTYYFSLVCCVCDMIPTIVDCNNEHYASFESPKYNDFLTKAVKSDVILIPKQ